MELRIQSINFDATDQLKGFIEKKTTKLKKFNEGIMEADVTLKVVKPETSKNKEASIKLKLNTGEAFAHKTADSFEEAIDLCLEALEKQIIKTKEKKER